MFDFLKRLRAIRQLVRKGRGRDLDRVLLAMGEGANFTGAKGVMLLALAQDRGASEMWMRKEGRQHLSDSLLGEAYARKVARFIRETRHDPLYEEERER